MSDEPKQMMGEEAKREFDALHALSEQAWRDWDHKTRHEWRLSFGLWAALLAASAALIQTSYRPNLAAVAIAGVVVVVLHLRFLAWIQSRSKEFRKDYIALRARIPELVRPSQPSGEDKCWCESPALWTQAAITILLVIVFAMVAVSEVPTDKRPPTKTSDVYGLTLAAADGPRAQS
jgi:hypothetical protein